MDLNHRPPVCEPVSQTKAEYSKIEQNIKILNGYGFSSFSAFMLF
jgi:hypothetical protein